MYNCISRPGNVLGRLCGGAFRRNIGLGQSAIHDEIRGIDEAALVAGKKYHRVRLLDGLAESTSGEVHFTTEALCLVVAEPVLEERSTKICQRSLITIHSKDDGHT